MLNDNTDSMDVPVECAFNDALKEHRQQELDGVIILAIRKLPNGAYAHNIYTAGLTRNEVIATLETHKIHAVVGGSI